MRRSAFKTKAAWRKARNREICGLWLRLVPVRSLVHRYGLVDSSIRRILRAGIAKRLLVTKRAQRWKRGIA